MEAAINSGGGEVRRVNVIYFLSRDGRVEHPHLLQIHRLRRDRVHLRDVKRWLSEVRGKQMPESFSWSYKRRYRDGYIWQDLMENDLITPFADNEFVLKGSELTPTTSTPKKEGTLSPVDEKTPKAWTTAAAENAAEVAAGAETLPVPPRDEQISPKPPPEIDGEYSSETLEELCREMAVVLKQKEKQEEPNDGVEDKRGAYFVDGRRKNNFNGGNSKKSNKKKAKRMLRNILGCNSAHQASDDALRSTSQQRQGRKQSGGGGCGGEGDANLRAGEMNGSSAGGGGNMWRKAGKQESAAVYKQPAAMATCSQCGKAFKPPKLHYHMQSCKGLARRGT